MYPTESNKQNIANQNSQFVHIEATHDSLKEWWNHRAGSALVSTLLYVGNILIFYHHISACQDS